MATGEIRRAFFKNKAFGDVYAVEVDDKGFVLAAKELSQPEARFACKHLLDSYSLSLDAADAINRHNNDYEVVEPPCQDATHQLRDIFDADRLAESALSEFEAAHRHAKSLKEIYEKHVEAGHTLRRKYREPPKDLPLFPSEARA
jgi:hypothetical protein